MTPCCPNNIFDDTSLMSDSLDFRQLNKINLVGKYITIYLIRAHVNVRWNKNITAKPSKSSATEKRPKKIVSV